MDVREMRESFVAQLTHWIEMTEQETSCVLRQQHVRRLFLAIADNTDLLLLDDQNFKGMTRLRGIVVQKLGDWGLESATNTEKQIAAEFSWLLFRLNPI
jgi:hypothetical protein